VHQDSLAAPAGPTCAAGARLPPLALRVGPSMRVSAGQARPRVQGVRVGHEALEALCTFCRLLTALKVWLWGFARLLGLALVP